jgi:SPX domain protein involved in polyphosphate accumulation
MSAAYLPTKMFAERSEHAYFLTADNARTFIDRVGEYLGAHCFYQSEADTFEPPAHYVTTLYFDSSTREILRACERGAAGVRLRAREYYDCDPKLGIRREPLLWLEVKASSGSSTRKTRFAIPSSEIHAFLSDGVITKRMLMLQRPTWGRSAEAVIQEIAELCTKTAGPLRPDCLAHYRRRAWQDVGETMRITLDTELSFHRPPPNLFRGGSTLSDAVAGTPAGVLRYNLVEIKLRRDQPTWLRQLILDLGLEPALDGRRVFSKFVAASRAVHSS